MVFTIAIILRAVCFNGVSSAKPSQVSMLFGVWQSVQFMFRALENIPIVSMNSSTGTPPRTGTLMKISSASCGSCSGPD